MRSILFSVVLTIGLSPLASGQTSRPTSAPAGITVRSDAPKFVKDWIDSLPAIKAEALSKARTDLAAAQKEFAAAQAARKENESLEARRARLQEMNARITTMKQNIAEMSSDTYIPKPVPVSREALKAGALVTIQRFLVLQIVDKNNALCQIPFHKVIAERRTQSALGNQEPTRIFAPDPMTVWVGDLYPAPTHDNDTLDPAFPFLVSGSRTYPAGDGGITVLELHEVDLPRWIIKNK